RPVAPTGCLSPTHIAYPSSHRLSLSPFFFFNDPPTTEIYPLSLHDALPICITALTSFSGESQRTLRDIGCLIDAIYEEVGLPERSEEHTSELQSLTNLVCRLLLEKKKKKEVIATRNVLLDLTETSHQHISRH